MGVYARQDSPYWWIAISRPGQRQHVENTRIPRVGATDKQTTQLRQDAEEAYLARAADLARARYDLPVDKPIITLAAYLPWYRTHRTARKDGAEQEEFRLAQLEREFGARPLHELTPEVVDAFRTRRLAKVKASTVNRDVTVLRAILSSAVPKYLDASPLDGLEDLDEDNFEGRPLTADEEPRLLAALKPADRAMLLMGLDTLMRLSDILDFEWARVRVGYGVIPDPKSGELLAVPFSRRLQRALAALPRTGRYLFPERRRGTAQQRRSRIRKMLDWACHKARIPYGRARQGITWHTATRHTGATRLSEAGHNTIVIQGIGGWKSPAMVKRYSHLSAAARAAVEDIGRSTSVVDGRRNTSKRQHSRQTAVTHDARRASKK
jgi:hypothetical protein